MVEFDTAKSIEDLQQILSLQLENHSANVTAKEMKSQGFVTVNHDLPLLAAMNEPYPHIVAREGEKVIAYALVMLKSFGNKIPVLMPMFDKINSLIYAGQQLKDSNYFVMGQVCIAKAYRGKHVFKGLYNHMKQQMQEDFEFIITEVATRNERSVRAHEKVGFKSILRYSDETEQWDIMLWDWK